MNVTLYCTKENKQNTINKQKTRQNSKIRFVQFINVPFYFKFSFARISSSVIIFLKMKIEHFFPRNSTWLYPISFSGGIIRPAQRMRYALVFATHDFNFTTLIFVYLYCLPVWQLFPLPHGTWRGMDKCNCNWRHKLTIIIGRRNDNFIDIQIKDKTQKLG